MRLCGISTNFSVLSPCVRLVAHALLTRSLLSIPSLIRRLVPELLVQLACVRHAASVCPEPGSNSPKIFFSFEFVCSFTFFLLYEYYYPTFNSDVFFSCCSIFKELSQDSLVILSSFPLIVNSFLKTFFIFSSFFIKIG